MRHVFAPVKCIVLAILILLTGRPAFAQNDSIQQHLPPDSAEIKYDSAKNQLFHHIKDFGDSEMRKKIRAFTVDTIATRQEETIELTKKLLLEAQNYLDNGLDTT